jgi:uncharacterized membrane protein YdjX (TVP38/TMEM64 family)
MNKDTRKKFFNIFIASSLFLLILVLIYFALVTFLPLIHEITRSGGNNEAVIADYLNRENDLQGMISLGVLQILQVISIFFPGAPIQIAGGLIYGTWKSFLICLVSFTFSNTLVFYLSRSNIGLIRKFLPGNSKSMTKLSSWINSSDPKFMSMLAYMLPGIPNGFIPHVASKTNISTASFSLSVLEGSFFQIFMMCAIGHQLIKGEWILSVLLFIIMIAMIIILYTNKSRIIQMRQNWRNRHQK